jgi:Tfp pilus assembly protein PilF
MMTSVWVHMALGGEKLNEARHILQDVEERYGASVDVLVNQALCSMQLGLFQEAEKHLLSAIGRSPNNALALANLYVCGLHLRRPQEQTQRYLSQLSSVAPSHALVQMLDSVAAAVQAI